MLFIKRKHFFFLFLLIFLSLFLLNCQRNKVVNSHGIMYLENRQELLKINESNKNDVINRLGQPHSTSISKKILGYTLKEQKQKVKYIPWVEMF